MTDKMALDETRFWLESLSDKLLKDYHDGKDDEGCFTSTAITRLLERNEELEGALQAVDNFKDGINKVIGKVL